MRRNCASIGTISRVRRRVCVCTIIFYSLSVLVFLMLRSFKQFFPRLRVLQMICTIRRADIFTIGRERERENVSMEDRLM